MAVMVLTSLLFYLLTLLAIVPSSVTPDPDNNSSQREVLSYHTTTTTTTTTVPHGPRVDVLHSGDVTTVLGQTASLRCRVLDRGNVSVSWIRHRDIHLLTVGDYTYTTDQRFQAMYEPSTGDWVLLVGGVQRRDQGVYECQISTTPPTSHFVALHIREPLTEILGGTDLHINTGSTINLTCLVLYHPRSPEALTWLHKGKEMKYTSKRGGVSVVTEAGEMTRSALLIQRATERDAGNYTCQPQGSPPATVMVHVVHVEHRAAIQGGVGGGGFPADTLLVLWAAVTCLWWAGIVGGAELQPLTLTHNRPS